jgi:type II secretory ATPase GspE/PulE/Tfp pilus assembly ATPase PilB-like protein
MGMDPFNFADALLGILAQRLARRLCRLCRVAYRAESDEIELLLSEYCAELSHTPSFGRDPAAARAAILLAWRAAYAGPDGRFTLHRAAGCSECNQGYAGRLGLHELMIGTDRVKQLLQEHARVAALLSAALEDGMMTLKMDGIEKVLQGHIDLRTVRQVCIK